MTEKEEYLSEKIREAVIEGASYLPNFLSKETTSGLQVSCNSLEYVLYEEQHASTVRESYFVPKDKKNLPPDTQKRVDALQSEMVSLIQLGGEEFPELSDWKPSDSSIQKYYPDSFITRHRDGKSNKGVVIVASIQGEAIFETSNEREGPAQNSWHLKEGDVTILGANGLNGIATGIFHAISGSLTPTPRISIGFRTR